MLYSLDDPAPQEGSRMVNRVAGLGEVSGNARSLWHRRGLMLVMLTMIVLSMA